MTSADPSAQPQYRSEENGQRLLAPEPWQARAHVPLPTTGTGRGGLTQMSCFSPIGKFEYRSTISGVLYMGVVFLVI